jgi:hypothetical protein
LNERKENKEEVKDDDTLRMMRRNVKKRELELELIGVEKRIDRMNEPAKEKKEKEPEKEPEKKPESMPLTDDEHRATLKVVREFLARDKDFQVVTKKTILHSDGRFKNIYKTERIPAVKPEEKKP